MQETDRRGRELENMRVSELSRRVRELESGKGRGNETVAIVS